MPNQLFIESYRKNWCLIFAKWLKIIEKKKDNDKNVPRFDETKVKFLFAKKKLLTDNWKILRVVFRIIIIAQTSLVFESKLNFYDYQNNLINCGIV